MENIIDNLEKEVGTVKEDLGNVKEYLLEMRELLRLREEREQEKDKEKEKSATSGNPNRNEGSSSERNRNGETTREERRIKKLELPIFNGDDPYGWTFRADRYFDVNQFEESERVEAAVVCMEGRALNWYQWTESRTPISTWRAFKATLIARFHLSFQGSAYEALVALKQSSTVTEFREEFESHAAPLKEIGEELLMGIFTNRLKEEIRAEIRLMKPNNLFELMEQAYRVKERNWVLDKGRPKFNRAQGGMIESYSRVTPGPEIT